MDLTELRDDIIYALSEHTRNSDFEWSCNCGAAPYDKHISQLLDRIILEETEEEEPSVYTSLKGD